MGGNAPGGTALQQLVERLRSLVRTSLRNRALMDSEAVVDVLTRTAAGWIVAQEQPLLGTPAIPVPETMYDDVAETMVQFYAHGVAEPPATKAANQGKARAIVTGSLEQLGHQPVAPETVDTLTLLSFGKWHEYELPMMLLVYAREFVAHYLRGLG